MRVRTCKESSRQIQLHEDVIRRFNLEGTIYISLKVGAFIKKIQLAATICYDADIILLSEDISDAVNLPEDLQYEIRVEDGAIHIGPVIGLLVSEKEEYLTENRLKEYLKYMLRYDEVGGLVVAFTFEGIMDEDLKVIGYAYHPETNSWRRGIYAFPGAVYIRRAHIRLKSYHRLEKLIGANFFNAYAFNKWEMWQWFSKTDVLSSHLPETVLASEEKEVKELLDRVEQVIFKPYKGYRGNGIYKVEKMEPAAYTVKYLAEECSVLETFTTWEELYRYISQSQDLQGYIAQHSISLLKFSGRLSDIRIIAQKGKKGIWQIQGMVTRYAGPENFVSNISRGGSAEPTRESLLKLYEGNEQKAAEKYQDLEAMALLICEHLDKVGFCYGNLGLDVAMDEQENLWLLEINNIYPDHTIALDADDDSLYSLAMSTPLLYTRWLSGFR